MKLDTMMSVDSHNLHAIGRQTDLGAPIMVCGLGFQNCSVGCMVYRHDECTYFLATVAQLALRCKFVDQIFGCVLPPDANEAG